MSNKLSIKEIREKYQYKGFYGQYINDHWSSFFSPYFTYIFVKCGVTPNQVTLLMILFGIIGAILFALPCLWLKFFGILFIHLWYIMDASDGEVARITRRFSTFGKEIDYTAHVINHPLYTISFLINTYQFPYLLSFLVLSVGLIDSIFRAVQSFNIIYDLKIHKNKETDNIQTQNPLIRFVKYLFLCLSTYPSYAMFFPILLLLDNNLAVWFTILVLITSSYIVIINVYNWLKRIINS